MSDELKIKEIKIDLGKTQSYDGLKVLLPQNVDDFNIKQAVGIAKAVESKRTDLEKSITISAIMLEMEEDEVKGLSVSVLTKITEDAINITTSTASTDYNLEDYRVIKFKDVKYAVEPTIGDMETGAFVDLIELARTPADNLHKIMAILYRPLLNSNGVLYEVSPYSSEKSINVAARGELFLNGMPYSFVKAIVNFMLSQVRN